VELSGLPYPAEDEPFIEQYSAVQLFLQNARRVRSDFSLTEQNSRCVARICRLVGGLPLGIELAASWTQTLSCQEISEKIASGMNFLQPQQTGLSQEQQSIKAVFDTFWASLSPTEQAIVSQLSVFKGTFSEEAACKIAGASPFFLEALVARSFLRRTPRGRYEPHELLRQYGNQQLLKQPNLLNATLNRHCSYYIDFLQQYNRSLHQEKRIIEEILIEIENVRSALQCSIQQLYQPGLEALSTFSLFCHQTGRLHEGLNFTQRAVQALRDHPEIPRLLFGQILQKQAMLLAWLNENEAAIVCAQEALQLAATLPNPILEAETRRVIGQILYQTSDYPAARSQLQTALQIAQEQNQPGLEAEILLNLGNIALETEIARLDIAQNYYAQALAIFRRQDKLSRQCAALNNLGLVALYRDDYESAQMYFEQNLILSRKISDRIAQGSALINLGTVDAFRRRLTQAEKYLIEARELMRTIGARQDEGIAIWTLGFIYLLGGDFVGAHVFLEQSLDQMKEIQNRASECRIYADLTLLALYEGRYLAGRDLSRQALLMADELELRDTTGYALTTLGHCLTALDKTEEAQMAYQQAEKLFQDLHRPFAAIDPLAGLVQLHLARDSRLRALGYTEKILELLQRAESAGTLNNQLCGLIEPSRAYLTCAHALQSIGDERAQKILEAGSAKLMAWANAIENEAMRQSFLENIPFNRLLLKEAQQNSSQSGV
jgi:tetratricopeptide (TPR) repeat protein